MINQHLIPMNWASRQESCIPVSDPRFASYPTRCQPPGNTTPTIQTEKQVHSILQRRHWTPVSPQYIRNTGPTCSSQPQQRRCEIETAHDMLKQCTHRTFHVPICSKCLPVCLSPSRPSLRSLRSRRALCRLLLISAATGHQKHDHYG